MLAVTFFLYINNNVFVSLKTKHLNHFTVANLPLVINSVDKPTKSVWADILPKKASHFL